MEKKFDEVLPTEIKQPDFEMIQNLINVKDFLKTKGWVKYRSCNEIGNVCLGMAIVSVTGKLPRTSQVVLEFVSEVISGTCRECMTHIVTYNDAPKTTFKDVMALLDRAIEKAKCG